jgi:hypothetical protein
MSSALMEFIDQRIEDKLKPALDLNERLVEEVNYNRATILAQQANIN